MMRNPSDSYPSSKGEDGTLDNVKAEDLSPEISSVFSGEYKFLMKAQSFYV